MLNFENAISKRIDLPSAPTVIGQLTALMVKEDVSSHKIARIVETDQALTARTLKLVNSPFYGFARQITSVKEAITMLGIGTMQQLLLATSVVSSLGAAGSALSMDDFWMHSFGVGVMAKHLLRTECFDTRNEAFICGVLHDIGRLLFAKMDPERYARFFDSCSSFADLDNETRWFGVDHQKLGYMLAQKWNFPAKIATAIAYHHTPDESPESPPLIAAIHIANVTCHALNLGHSGSEYVAHFSPSAWQLLNLDKGCYEQVLRRSLDEIGETEAMIRNAY